MSDATLRSSVSIHASAGRVFDFLVSPEKIPLVLPGLVENTDIPPLPLKEGASFHFLYQMYGVMLRGTWTVKVVEPDTRYEAITEGEVASKWKYVLTERDGSTNVDLVIEYETPRSVLQKIKSEFML
ncbi:MAG TPA: SRPBCC family protein, partial [Gemmatimonadaceae bacterium]